MIPNPARYFYAKFILTTYQLFRRLWVPVQSLAPAARPSTPALAAAPITTCPMKRTYDPPTIARANPYRSTSSANFRIRSARFSYVNFARRSPADAAARSYSFASCRYVSGVILRPLSASVFGRWIFRRSATPGICPGAGAPHRGAGGWLDVVAQRVSAVQWQMFRVSKAINPTRLQELRWLRRVRPPSVQLRMPVSPQPPGGASSFIRDGCPPGAL